MSIGRSTDRHRPMADTAEPPAAHVDMSFHQRYVARHNRRDDKINERALFITRRNQYCQLGQ